MPQIVTFSNILSIFVVSMITTNENIIYEEKDSVQSRV